MCCFFLLFILKFCLLGQCWRQICIMYFPLRWASTKRCIHRCRQLHTRWMEKIKNAVPLRNIHAPRLFFLFSYRKNTIAAYSAYVVHIHKRLSTLALEIQPHCICTWLYTHTHTKGQPETPIHVQAFPRMVGLMAVPAPLALPHKQTYTHAHTLRHTHLCLRRPSADHVM